MKRLAALLLLVASLASSAARADWRSDYDKAQDALSAKDYATAENLAISALNAVDALPEEHDDKLTVKLLLARIYQDTRQWAAAAPLYEQVIDAYKKRGIDGSPEAGNAYNMVGIVYVKMKELIKAEQSFQASLQIKRKKYKQNVASIAIVLSNLGELYRQQRKWKEAEELHKQAISDKENELGPEHPDLVTSLNNLAIVYRETNRLDEALPLLERARDIGKKAIVDNPDERVNYATALHNLAEWYALKKQFDKAEALYKEALQLRRTALGNEHPHVAETLMNYANMLASMGRGEESLPMYDEAIVIRRNEFGRADARVVKAMQNKLMALQRMKRTDEAKKLEDEIKALQAPASP